MGAYDFNFDLPPGETYAPSADRVRALAALMPKAPFAFAPPVTDRAAWDRWQNDPFGQQVLKSARELAAEPYPDYTDATYLDCLAREDVTKINTVMPIVRKRQVAFLVAEAIYDRGEFIPLLVSDAQELAKLRTWIHPGNDLKKLNYDLKTVEPDLGVVHFADNLAQIDYILGPRLPADFRQLIREETNRRMFAPMRQRLETGRDLYWWINVKHNWNSVCLASIAEAAAALLPDGNDRAWWFAFAESLVKNFRDGFNDDGLCTEGVGYWSYGFMHYILMGELLRTATGGVIDLLDEPKMARAAAFPDRVEIEPKVFPTFSDCALNAQPVFWARRWMDNRTGTIGHATEPVTGVDPFAGMNLQFGAEIFLWMYRTHDPRAPRQTTLKPALHNWFASSSLLVSRPAPTTKRRFSATFLGGNNGVNHNHNDLGTFTVVLDGRTLVVDPGAEIYSFRTFSTHRYDSNLLNSYGHPVPKVAGRLQEAGAEYHARVLSKEFTDETDRVVFDLRYAYDVPTLRKLEREYLYDRRGAGSLTITDRVEFTEPAAFESALVTLGQAAINGSQVKLTDGDAVLTADITVEGAGLELSTDKIDQPPHPVRIAVRCAAPVRTATITTVLRPA